MADSDHQTVDISPKFIMLGKDFLIQTINISSASISQEIDKETRNNFIYTAIFICVFFGYLYNKNQSDNYIGGTIVSLSILLIVYIINRMNYTIKISTNDGKSVFIKSKNKDFRDRILGIIKESIMAHGEGNKTFHVNLNDNSVAITDNSKRGQFIDGSPGAVAIQNINSDGNNNEAVIKSEAIKELDKIFEKIKSMDMIHKSEIIPILSEIRLCVSGQKSKGELINAWNNLVKKTDLLANYGVQLHEIYHKLSQLWQT